MESAKLTREYLLDWLNGQVAHEILDYPINYVGEELKEQYEHFLFEKLGQRSEKELREFLSQLVINVNNDKFMKAHLDFVNKGCLINMIMLLRSISAETEDFNKVRNYVVGSDEEERIDKYNIFLEHVYQLTYPELRSLVIRFLYSHYFLPLSERNEITGKFIHQKFTDQNIFDAIDAANQYVKEEIAQRKEDEKEVENRENEEEEEDVEDNDEDED